MEYSIEDAFLSLGNVYDSELFDFTFPVPIEPPYAQTSPILPCEEPVPSIEDIPDLVTDYKPAVQDSIEKLASLVSELLGRVASLEDQLQSETRRREAIVYYIKARLPSDNMAVERSGVSVGNLDVPTIIYPPRVNMIVTHIFPLTFALCTIATTINVEQTVALAASKTDGQVMHHVSVGLQGSPIFVPNRLNANIGDQILFEFHNLNHTLTQSSLDKPCSPIGGFDTGFNQYNPQNRDGLVVGLTVNSLDPQWFFCKQEQPLSHCHAGMVFALNPGDQMGTFLSNVRRDNSDPDLGTVSTDPLTSTLVTGSGTSLSSTTISLHGTSSTSAAPGSTFTSGSVPTPAASGPVFTSGTASTHQHSHASAVGLITPVVVTTVTQTVGCTGTANRISLKRSTSTAVFSSEGNASSFSPFVASLGFALGLAIIIAMTM
ncbi:hypothetical protein BDW75DRAFT_248412 [Aspergillus navahoensis]